MWTRFSLGLCIVAVGTAGLARAADEPGPRVAFAHDPAAASLRITVAGRPLGTYVYRDREILRPYFAHLHAPNGVQVTRRHPPVAGEDPADHPTMHPGLWLAFGDLGGSDFWRNKGQVEHQAFLFDPVDGAGQGSFVVANRYVRPDGQTVAREVARFRIVARPNRWLILWDSEFRPVESALVFGDQEEMGLGLRLATPLAVKQGGRLFDSEEHEGEKSVRGRATTWAAGSGKVFGREAAVAVLNHPLNFRPSWWHARDYGLIVANPFGREALTGGAKSRVEIKPGESLRLRFGVALIAPEGNKPPDVNAAYQDYRDLVP